MARRMRSLDSALVEMLPVECAGCVFWETEERLPRHCGASCDVEKARASIDYVRMQWGECGKVAVQDGSALGFIKYAPPGYFPQTAQFPAAPPSNDAVFITCLHVSDEVRHRGLGKLLLHAALRDLFLRGERAVEAYGTPGSGIDLPVISLDFLVGQGFVVERPHAQLPLMRLNLKSLAALTENIEAVLQGLQLPLRVHNGATAPYIRSETRSEN